jgi:hypothetical protein
MVSRESYDNGSNCQGFDDAEKGLYDSTQVSTALPRLVHMNRRTSWFETIFSPISPIHEGNTPSSTLPVLSLSWPTGFRPAKKPARPKIIISRWILFTIWFNTYRKFFTFVTLLNLTGIIMAALGRFTYANNHLGALVLGNLLCAILMRNELFLRFLYIIAIYGLRSASSFFYFSPDGY